MEYRPHEYQRYCSEYIVAHPEAAIFLDCGLGKTSITLSALWELMFDSFTVHKVLIVAPLRVGKVSWPDELKKWDAFHLFRYSVVIGTAKERMAALQQKAHLYIVNRENLQWLIEKSGMPFDYDTVVLDELSSFKNWQSKRFRAFMKVRPRVKRVIGLTGTPSGNGLMDLFAEFRCLDMGYRLGRFITQYRNAFFSPDKMNGQIVYSYKPQPGAEERIYNQISDITISMKALDHLQMPELISNSYPVYMSADESDLYDTLKKELVLPYKKDGYITAQNAAVLTGKLCQLANGSIYSDTGEQVFVHNKKLDALEDIVEAAGGKPLMVAYWYRHDLSRIEGRLQSLGVVYEKLDSEASMRRWNEGETQVALIHPASMGHGTNLQAGGNTLVWFGLTWSLELYQQTIARLWRQGQKERTVVVQHIVTAGTVDEDILKALTRKEATQEALINAVKAQL